MNTTTATRPSMLARLARTLTRRFMFKRSPQREGLYAHQIVLDNPELTNVLVCASQAYKAGKLVFIATKTLQANDFLSHVLTNLGVNNVVMQRSNFCAVLAEAEAHGPKIVIGTLHLMAVGWRNKNEPGFVCATCVLPKEMAIQLANRIQRDSQVFIKYRDDDGVIKTMLNNTDLG